jgi:hypothetical protein
MTEPDFTQTTAPKRPGRFALIGHGWRADFFLRIARQAPEYFDCAGAVTRTYDVSRWSGSEGIPSYRSIGELIADQEVDVVVVSIPRTEAAAVIAHLAGSGCESSRRRLPEAPPGEASRRWSSCDLRGVSPA